MPVGTPAAGATAPIVAVNVIGWPTTGCVEVTPIDVLPLPTVRLMVCEVLVLKSLSPP